MLRLLGSGAFGVVYEVRDTAKDAVVALKSLQHVTPESLYRFKREFRSLADLNHPNLVQLYELGSEDDQWFFTMERVEGRDFLQYVRGRPSSREEMAGVLHETGTAGSLTGASAGPSAVHTTPDPAAADPEALARLGAALPQLVSGLSALHRAGQVHRDVKPSNVLVTDAGRVVLLDFGLVMDVASEASVQSMRIAGTPIYMSPEQAAGLPVTPASDWYSVGVMLYEALTGRPPFTGSMLDIIVAKQQREPPPPSGVAEGIPETLDALCRALLRRDARERPGADDILRALDGPGRRVFDGPASRTRARERTPPFVGRKKQIEALRAACDAMVAGMPSMASLCGASGIGKSALARAFLGEIHARHPDAVILTGRCYERESVPYKALDSLVDATARYLKRLPAHETDALLPRDLGALAHLFPVMRQFQARVAPVRRLEEPPDTQELRRRAYGALRELLARLSDKHPLVLFIDDLQWGDIDSASLLKDLLRQPDAPVLLLIAAYRDVEIDTSPFLRSFLASVDQAGLASVRVVVDRLTAQESHELATALLDSSETAPSAIASTIALEAGGSPFFIDELVRAAELSADGAAEPGDSASTIDSGARDATLANLIRLRLSRLPETAQQMVHLVALNGRPVPEPVLTSATLTGPHESMLAVLRSEHLLRARETDGGTEFETYHDRIREAIVRGLDEAQARTYHARLAGAFESQGGADPELLAEHLFAAGAVERAAEQTLVAARAADEALAFDRSARLYRRVLDLPGRSPDQREALSAALGDALANAGRGADAAAVYLSTSPAARERAIALKQKAAQQLLFAGHVDEGLAVIRDVLASIGMRLPETRLETLLALVRGRLRVRLRGLSYRERAAADIPAGKLFEIDVCWSVSAGLGLVDTVRAAVFQTDHLLRALDAGEIARIHRAFCMEAGLTARKGSGQIARTQQLLGIIEALMQRIGTPEARARYLLFLGVTHYLVGRWRDAVVAIAEAETLLRDQCTGLTWELDSSRFFSLWAHYFLGEVGVIATRFDPLLKDASDRGDLYASTMIGGFLAHFVFLAADDPASATRYTTEALARWSQRGFHLQHMWKLWSSVDIALYEGKGTHAWALIERAWPALKRSLLLDVQLNDVTMHDLRARASLAAAQSASSAAARRRLLRVASRCAARLDAQRVEWATALAQVTRAGMHLCAGDGPAATRRLGEAEQALAALDMHLLAAVVRRRRAELLHGGERDALMESSAAVMDAQGIRDHAAWARMFVVCGGE